MNKQQLCTVLEISTVKRSTISKRQAGDYVPSNNNRYRKGAPSVVPQFYVGQVKEGTDGRMWKAGQSGDVAIWVRAW